MEIIDYFPYFLRRYFDNRPHLQKIIDNSGWLTFEKIFRLGLGLLVSIFVARYLGPDKFGILRYAISLMTFMGTFVYLGLSGLVIRDIVNNPQEINVILGTTFTLKLIGSILGYAILTTIVYLSGAESIEKTVLLVIALAIFFRPFETIDYWYHSQTRSKFSVYAKSLAFIAASLAKILLVILHASLLAFAFVTFVEVALAACFLVIIYQSQGQNIFRWRVYLIKAKELLGLSWILILSDMFAMVYFKIDQIMLRWLIDAKEVGVYSVAVTFSETWYFIPSIIALSVYPTLLQQKKTNGQQYKKNLQKTMDILFFIAFSVALVVTFFGPKVILFLYGDPYRKAGYILMIHIWAGIFIFMRSLFSRWILIENMLVFSLITHGLGAVANVVLNIILIKPYAGYGAAAATLLSYAIASYFALFINTRTRTIAYIMTKSFSSPIRIIIRICKSFTK